MAPPFKRREPAQPEPANPRLARLTNEERRLLKYPPTPLTWICQKKFPAGQAGDISWPERICGLPNAGSRKKCVFCGTPKPSIPKLVWPRYIAVCLKAGVEPRQKGKDA